MNQWTIGQCASCDTSLDSCGHPALYCGEHCRGYAKDVRYFRKCARLGKMMDSDVREALKIRMSHLVVGGYSSKARVVAPKLRADVLTANGGLCCACDDAPATELDHISGSSGERDNLQGLCDECHNSKTRSRMTAHMNAEQRVIRDAFLARVRSKEPLRLCDNYETWDGVRQSLLADTREWCKWEQGDIDSGYFGDGSTGLEDDYEHGYYLQMLADRDD